MNGLQRHCEVEQKTGSKTRSQKGRLVLCCRFPSWSIQTRSPQSKKTLWGDKSLYNKHTRQRDASSPRRGVTLSAQPAGTAGSGLKRPSAAPPTIAAERARLRAQPASCGRGTMPLHRETRFVSERDRDWPAGLGGEGQSPQCRCTIHTCFSA